MPELIKDDKRLLQILHAKEAITISLLPLSVKASRLRTTQCVRGRLSNVHQLTTLLALTLAASYDKSMKRRHVAGRQSQC